MFFNVQLFIVLYCWGATIASAYICFLDRRRNGEKWFGGKETRSKCESCDHALSWVDLIPTFGFIVNKGRCRYCGAKIPIHSFVSETFLGLTIAIGFFVIKPYNSEAALINYLFAFLLCLAAINDIAYREVELPISALITITSLLYQIKIHETYFAIINWIFYFLVTTWLLWGVDIISRLLRYIRTQEAIGHGITCVSDLVNDEEVWKVMLALCQDIGHRLRVHELSAQGVQINLRGNDLHSDQFQCKLPFRTQLPSEIGAAAFRLFKERYHWNTNVRAVTVRAIDLVSQKDPNQISIFVDTVKVARRETLEDAIEDLRGRFGKYAVTYGILLGDLKMPDDGRHMVKMPGLMYS